MALPRLSLPFAGFSFGGATAGLLWATTELMAVEIGSHSDRYKVYKKSQRGLLKKSFYITITLSSSLPTLQNGVAPQCPNNVGHTSPEQPIPLSVKYKVDIPASLGYISVC